MQNESIIINLLKLKEVKKMIIFINRINANLEDIKKLLEDLQKNKTKITYKRIINNKLYINTL